MEKFENGNVTHCASFCILFSLCLRVFVWFLLCLCVCIFYSEIVSHVLAIQFCNSFLEGHSLILVKLVS